VKKFILISLLLVCFIPKAFAIIEITANYTFSKQIYGAEDLTDDQLDVADTSITKSYQLVWNWYIWGYTAIDINFSRESTEIQQTLTDGTQTINISTQLEGQTQGIGLRQAFAGKDAAIRPSIAIGYAKQKFNNIKNYSVDGVAVGPIKESSEYDSTYVTLSFRLAFSKLMGLTLGGTTVVPGTDFGLASRNLKYFAGFSWIF
jgi:hypothetical protein